ncbi:MAG: FAD-dependent monooxygenase [Nitriliruptorales bacterium]
MRVSIVGGGPGGLYTAILLKRADPATEVVLYERNAPDDTFGFGVVFSAATLRELEDADAPSYAALMAACARWDPVEIVCRDERIRAHGNRFAAVSRHRLLALLQERCRELDVDLRFRTEVADVEALRDADLVVGADGVNSVVRSRYAGDFRPQLTVEGSTFIWLGTTKAFPAFTFIFLETDHGPLQAHIYPYSETMSTFIVECTREVWRAAGLEGLAAADLPPGASDVESLKFLQELFADHLDGHELVGNNSKWLDWTTVRNRRWRHGNVVLLGDAAHTAHFSIGSGTKLALEDAIALARGLDRHADLDTALADYESARQPAVLRAQEAAAESLDWFARYQRYLGFDPPLFAYSLLTRSERVDHDNLRRRDPDLVLAIDRWFGEEAARDGHASPLLVPPPPALTGLTLAGRRLPNRTVLLVPDDQRSPDGQPSRARLRQLDRAARGGAGLVLVEHVAVSEHARISPADTVLASEDGADPWRHAIAALRAGGVQSLVGIQLSHAGPRGSTRPRSVGVDLPLRAGGWTTVAASAIPYTTVSPAPAPLDERRRREISEDFVRAAGLTADAGFDLLELEFAHGYLLASFLSRLTNRRDDELGGDLDGRITFPLEVLEAVRAAWPADRPLSVRFSASDLEPGGITEDEAVEVGRRFGAAGADVLHVVAGQTTRRSRPDYTSAWYYGRWSDLIRNASGVPTIGSGAVTTVSEANHVLAAGKADLVVLGRPLPEEPAWLAARRGPEPNEE